MLGVNLYWINALIKQPLQKSVQLDGIELCYFEWGSPDAQPLLLVHATGFHGRCWDQVIAALTGRYRIIAPDMRGHGRSTRPPDYNWRRLGADLTEFVQVLQLRDCVAAGHSMGGHCVVQSAAALPDRFQRLVLIDPVIIDPANVAMPEPTVMATVEDHPVSKRRREFPSWQAMRDQLRTRGSYGLWQPEVLDDYCRYGLLAQKGSRLLELACPPEVEAAIYQHNNDTSIYDLLPKVRQPVVVLRAFPREASNPVMDFSKSPTWPQLAAQFHQGRDVLLEQLTHFIPMQDPVLTARYIDNLA